MLESKVQAKIIKELEAKGWYILKLIQTNKNGIPDLLCLKGGKAVFLEVKNDKGKPSKMQDYRIEQLNNNGFIAAVVNNTNDAIRICEQI